VLVPGGRFTVEAFGGPPLQPQFFFSVENQTVCSVDADGQVTGLAPGLTNLMVEETSSISSSASIATIPVLVNPLDGMMLFHSYSNLIFIFATLNQESTFARVPIV